MLGRNKQGILLQYVFSFKLWKYGSILFAEFVDKALQQDMTIQNLTMNAVRNVTENSNKVEDVFGKLNVSSSEVCFILLFP